MPTVPGFSVLWGRIAVGMLVAAPAARFRILFTLACMFGWKTIEEIEDAFRGSLYRALTNHFMEEKECCRVHGVFALRS